MLRTGVRIPQCAVSVSHKNSITSPINELSRASARKRAKLLFVVKASVTWLERPFCYLNFHFFVLFSVNAVYSAIFRFMNINFATRLSSNCLRLSVNTNPPTENTRSDGALEAGTAR